MTGFDKVFIDTAPFIYFLERNDVFVGKVADFFGYCIDNDKLLVTSTVALDGGIQTILDTLKERTLPADLRQAYRSVSLAFDKLDWDALQNLAF